MFFLENFKLAISSLRANKMRSFLTMLGIIIGISSVITIMTLGEIGKASIGKEFEGFGTHRVSIRLNWSDEIRSTDFLSDSELEKIKNAFSKEIKYISPITWGSGKAKKNKSFAGVDIQGTNDDYKYVGKVDIINGRFLNNSDIKARRYVAVINKKLALKLFKRANVVGETVKIESGDSAQRFVIVGVYQDPPSVFDKFNKDDTTLLYAPVSVVEYGGLYSSVQAQLSKTVDIDLTCNKIAEYASRIKNKKGLYSVRSAKSEMNIVDNVLSKISLGIGAVAAISLLVGGIGVMNIMLVSVTERTREIGIRKALGAKRKDILLQFLVESMIISGVGGLIGVTLGLGISNIAAIVLKVNPSVPIRYILISVSFSAIVGVFFGLYPANKAAKLDPIEALRYE